MFIDEKIYENAVAWLKIWEQFEVDEEQLFPYAFLRLLGAHRKWKARTPIKAIDAKKKKAKEPKRGEQPGKDTGQLDLL